MSISYNNLTIRGRDGRRVPVTDCNLEPLNLLIPGGAPILVPKRTAWRPPRSSNDKETVAAAGSDVPSAEYDAEGEDEGEDEGDGPLFIAKKYGSSRSRSKRKGKGKAKERCRKDSHIKDKAREAKHRRQAELLLGQSERARERADERRERLARRIEKQEAYVARLKAKYEAQARDKKKEQKKKASTAESATKKGARTDESGVSVSATTTETTTTSDSDGDATTDGSTKVREILKKMKIRAAGSEGFGAHGNGPFTTSEDAQLLVHKNNNESWKFITEAMGRGKTELQKRFKELKASNATIPGECIEVDDGGDKGGTVSSGAATAGETTTDVEKTGEETTDAEKTEDENKDDGGGDPFLGGLIGALEAAAEEEAANEAPKSPEKQKNVLSKSNKSNKNKNKNKEQQKQKNSPGKGDGGKEQNSPPKPSSENIAGGESGYDASASEAVDDSGTKAYIGQYAKQLLAEANAGLIKIPETDDNFDEDDCILLALADSYRRKNRWLDIQSDFANVTGRLVPDEVLKWKLGEGEQPEGH